MKPVLYFHGFASSPESAKILALRPLLESRGIDLVTPDLNVPSFEKLDWDAMTELAVAQGNRIAPHAVVGSSLGALLALQTVRRGVVAPLVLIAPALGIGERWLTKLPAGDPVVLFNHARAADAPIHRRFFEQLASLHLDDDPPPSRVVVLMGRDDETVPFHLVAETWARWSAGGLVPGSRFIEIPGGDHGLTAHAETIAREIEAATR